MPGELVAPAGSDTKGGYYTPIAGEIEGGFRARPLFYGMLLANQLAGTDMKAATLSAAGVDATAYAGRHPDGWRIAIFNKDSSRSLDLTVQTPSRCRQGKVWRLAGPSLDATTGVSLAGAEVGPDLTWSPRTVGNYAVTDGRLRVAVPSNTAALLFLDA
ncbi:MAG: hypothetical protein WDM96_12700 [Lacunisphaera sp.]